MTTRRAALGVGAATGLVMAGAVTAGAVTAGSAAGAVVAEPHRSPLVDPFVGTTGAPPWFSGNTSPAAVRPFGMVQLGPDTTDDPAGTPSRTASGYSSDDGLLRGFSPTHLSGAGCPAFGDVPVLPWTAELPAELGGATVPIDHAQEAAGPGWYRAELGNGVGVRLTAAERAGLAVYRFPEGTPGTLLVKGSGSLAGARDVQISFPGDRAVAVSTTSGRFCGSPGEYRVHVLLRFDRPVEDRGTWPGGAWVDFGDSAGRVATQVAVSFVDPGGARRNLRDARLGWSYRPARDAAADAWRQELGRVVVEDADHAARAVFETALYHALLHPTLLSDADGRYPGFDGRVHSVPATRRHYTAVAGWDAYRTQLPLLAWLRPDVASDVVGSLHRAGRQGGWLPRWPLVASYTGVMNGDSAAPMVAAVHAFGGRAFPLRTVVGQLARQAGPGGGPPGQGWFLPRPGLADYLALGYVPDDLRQGAAYTFGASTTLEYAVDDFALSRLADAAARPRLATRMLVRSASWQNLLEPGRRLVLPRDDAGGFPGPDYDPAACCVGFEEGNAVQYTWSVPHDMAGLLGRLGEREQVLGRLSAFHEQLDAFAFEPHAWLGNQPSFATPWAYLWLGAPWASQDVVARAREQLWESDPRVLPGNDDLGSLSAWYVWASLGLYPLTPGTADVGIGLPAFTEVTVDPSHGPPTRIVRRGDGVHVGGVRVDGVPRSASWLPLGPEDRPARVVVRATEEAQPTWGTSPADAPPSYPPPS